MPTYDYRCKACGHEFEEFQSIKAGALRKCPECKELKLQRLIGSGAGILFKGSGFYETDYRSESYKKEQANEKGDPQKGKEAPDKVSDTAPVTQKSQSDACPSSAQASDSRGGSSSGGNKSRKD